MREVVENPDEAHERAERGRATIEQDFSVERAAAFLRERLAEIHARPSRANRTSYARRACGQVRLDRARASGGRRLRASGRSAGWWRTVLGRALRPYTSRQREFESAVANALVIGERRLNELEDLLATAPYVADPDLLRFRLDDGAETIGYTERGASPSFEEVFGGSEDRVRDLRRPYLTLIGDLQPVLDLRSGRGELLDLLAEAGVPASGVEADPALAARSREKGHEVVEEDALAHLSALPEGLLGAVFASGLVEQLDFDDLQRLLALARPSARPGRGSDLRDHQSPFGRRIQDLLDRPPPTVPRYSPRWPFSSARMAGLRLRAHAFPGRHRDPRTGSPTTDRVRGRGLEGHDVSLTRRKVKARARTPSGRVSARAWVGCVEDVGREHDRRDGEPGFAYTPGGPKRQRKDWAASPDERLGDHPASAPRNDPGTDSDGAHWIRSGSR